MRTSIRILLIIISLGILTELGIRIFSGRPRGTFDFAAVTSQGTYPPNTTLRMEIGPLPYTLTTNSLGLRSAEVSRDKPPGTLRIVAVGDSVTNGFYVADNETFPALLEKYLRSDGKNVEVINLARGGASIGEEYAAIRTIGLPLSPDIVILTFVTNDIAALKGFSEEKLRSYSLAPGAFELFISTLLRKSALAELSAEHALGILIEKNVGKAPPEFSSSPESSEIVARNIRNFHSRYAATDGLVLSEPWTTETEKLFSLYAATLRDLNRHVNAAHARLIFVYCPSYDQIFREDPPLRIIKELQEITEQEKIAFVDLTSALKDAARESRLHYTPVDFHFTPAGNAAFARALARFIEQETSKLRN